MPCLVGVVFVGVWVFLFVGLVGLVSCWHAYVSLLGCGVVLWVSLVAFVVGFCYAVLVLVDSSCSFAFCLCLVY